MDDYNTFTDKKVENKIPDCMKQYKKCLRSNINYDFKKKNKNCEHKLIYCLNKKVYSSYLPLPN